MDPGQKFVRLISAMAVSSVAAAYKRESPSCLVARLGSLCVSCRAGSKVGVERSTRAGGLRRVCGGKQKNGKMGGPCTGQRATAIALLVSPPPLSCPLACSLPLVCP